MPTLAGADFRLDRVEIATIIAALYHWNESGGRPEELEYIACGFGDYILLDTFGILQLIERFTEVT
ncbi:hypothetical protein [Shinella sumterensis]|jgi:hypothetical protein|uniref:Uncharacterized protein n=1 Tax=Shinella sumterensis TaxID=1967501 RepID=A0AA50CV70_9HYPH|nr:hypothetical protein [Shinella sumterensis]WLS01143.1 hypothetical protein Q9313_27580 [Shinella sumterensis]